MYSICVIIIPHNIIIHEVWVIFNISCFFNIRSIARYELFSTSANILFSYKKINLGLIKVYFSMFIVKSFEKITVPIYTIAQNKYNTIPL